MAETISPELKQAIEQEIKRLEDRALKNKWRSDMTGAIVIVLGACSGILIAVPDSALEDLGISIARQVLPVLTAAAYAALRYYRWGDKHLWYWYQRHRMKGLLIRGSEGDSGLAREYAEILLTAEANYPQPIYAAPQPNETEPESAQQIAAADRADRPRSG